ncbi:hypothetical protein E1B28_002482 [Marasmius oreades]|uniref:Uncharacterized protein n=1 Tax=Marasmius oreades TaxID=181124 RepID=A0A9P7RMQ6_9AGAR|nr:uncharacterized protein E1B28_002482 [Marasmius oreades]KAG7086531.1 hypothetical protein E1B28_002482 [Marasmius oreades]
MANLVLPTFDDKIEVFRSLLEHRGCPVYDPEFGEHDIARMFCCWGRSELGENGTVELSPVRSPVPMGKVSSKLPPVPAKEVSPLLPFPQSGVITVQSEYLQLERRIMEQYAYDHAYSKK